MTASDDVWAAVTAIYTAFLAGDRVAVDAHISADATMWDAFHEPLIRGKGQLDDVRDARPAGGAQPVDLRAGEPVIDVYGDLAVVRHLLTAVYADGAEQRIRNTGVWRRADGRWLCVHNHEDTRP